MHRFYWSCYISTNKNRAIIFDFFKKKISAFWIQAWGKKGENKKKPDKRRIRFIENMNLFLVNRMKGIFY